MLSDLIRLAVTITDWRSWLRTITFKPEFDILFLSNISSNTDRRRLTGLFNTNTDHFGLVRLRLANIIGHIRVINSSYEEVLSKEGFKEAKNQALNAIKLAREKG